eukprot:4174256-Prymnesium_polylepis.1
MSPKSRDLLLGAMLAVLAVGMTSSTGEHTESIRLLSIPRSGTRLTVDALRRAGLNVNVVPHHGTGSIVNPLFRAERASPVNHDYALDEPIQRADVTKTFVLLRKNISSQLSSNQHFRRGFVLEKFVDYYNGFVMKWCGIAPVIFYESLPCAIPCIAEQYNRNATVLHFALSKRDQQKHGAVRWLKPCVPKYLACPHCNMGDSH